MTISEEGDFTPEFEVRIGVERVEATGGWAGQYVLGEPSQQDAFEMFDAIFTEPRYMKLKQCTDATSWGYLTGRNAIQDLFDASFAIAQDCAAGVPGRFLTSCQQPLAIARGDQHPRVETSKGFGVGVFDESAPLWVRPWRSGGWFGWIRGCRVGVGHRTTFDLDRCRHCSR